MPAPSHGRRNTAPRLASPLCLGSAGGLRPRSELRLCRFKNMSTLVYVYVRTQGYANLCSYGCTSFQCLRKTCCFTASTWTINDACVGLTSSPEEAETPGFVAEPQCIRDWQASRLFFVQLLERARADSRVNGVPPKQPSDSSRAAERNTDVRRVLVHRPASAGVDQRLLGPHLADVASDLATVGRRC